MPGKKIKKPAKPFHLRFFLVLLLVLLVFVFAFYVQLDSSKTYTGTLPCADCSGIQTTLLLNGNHTYTLTSLYIGRDTSFVEKGTWQQVEKNNMQVYQLQNAGTISYYERVDQYTLKMLDTRAHVIDAPFNLELHRK